MSVPRAAASDFVFVNLFREPIGAPMRPDAIGELLAAASRRAGLDAAGPPAPAAARLRQQPRRCRGRHRRGRRPARARLGVLLAGVSASRPGPAAGRGGPGAQPARAGRGDPVTGADGRSGDVRGHRRPVASRFDTCSAGVGLTGPAARLAGHAGAADSWPRPAGTRRPGCCRCRPSIGCWAGRCAGSAAARPPRTATDRRRVLALLHPADRQGLSVAQIAAVAGAAAAAGPPGWLRGRRLPADVDRAPRSLLCEPHRAQVRREPATVARAVPHRSAGAAAAAVAAVPGGGLHPDGPRARRLLRHPLQRWRTAQHRRSRHWTSSTGGDPSPRSWPSRAGEPAGAAPAGGRRGAVRPPAAHPRPAAKLTDVSLRAVCDTLRRAAGASIARTARPERVPGRRARRC